MHSPYDQSLIEFGPYTGVPWPFDLVLAHFACCHHLHCAGDLLRVLDAADLFSKFFAPAMVRQFLTVLERLSCHKALER